jgi:hypothetical protein
MPAFPEAEARGVSDAEALGGDEGVAVEGSPSLERYRLRGGINMVGRVAFEWERG